MLENASQTLQISKISWGSMPPDTPPQVPRAFSPSFHHSRLLSFSSYQLQNLFKPLTHTHTCIKAHTNEHYKSQHRCMLLGVFDQHCCARLHGPKKFDRFQTIRNKCQHCCGSMEADATSWAQQCCVMLAKTVASVSMAH